MGNWQDGLVSKAGAPAATESWRDGVVQPQAPAQASAPPTSNWQDGVVQPKGPQPQSSLNLPSDMTIERREPSLWEKAKDLFSSGPILHNTEFGDVSALADVGSKYASLTGHPTISKVLGGYGAAQGALDEQIKETTTPSNLALMGATAGLSELPGAAGTVLPKLASLGFSEQMLTSAYNSEQAVRDAADRGDTNAVIYHLTHGLASTIMAGMSAGHAFSGPGVSVAGVEGEPAFEAKQGDPLTPAEHMYVNSAIQANIEHGLKTGNTSQVADAVEAAKEARNATSTRDLSGGVQQVPLDVSPLESGDTGLLSGPRSEGEGLTSPSGSGEENLRSDLGAAGGERGAEGDLSQRTNEEASTGSGTSGVVGQRYADFLNKTFTKIAQENAGQGVLDDMEEHDISPKDVNKQFWEQTYFDMPATAQDKFTRYVKSLTGFKPGDTIGTDSNGQPIVAQDWAHIADAILDMPSKASNLEGSERGLVAGMQLANQKFSEATSQGATAQQVSARIASYGPIETATLGSVAQLHQAETGTPLNIADEAGMRGNGSVVDRPPAISEPIDRDLANGGITVMRPGKDLGLIARYLGSISQSAARLGNPFFKSISDVIADTTISLARNGRDSINDFRSGTRALISPEEWTSKVVPLLNDAKVTPDSLPEGLPDNIKRAYLNERGRLDNDRLEVIQAKRQAYINSGVTPAKAAEWVPDDWGIKQGYYHHAFPGNWTIMERTSGGEYQPIDTGWRQIDFDSAHAKAREYLDANPNAQLQVKLDTATLPGKSITDRNRLLNLKEAISSASELVYNGEDPNGVLNDLRKESAAAAYGPRRPAQRTNEAIQQREANLPGWANDLDNYERYIMGIERYKVLAPARQLLMETRNKIASMSGMPEATRIGDFPRRYSGQYANMLGRVDASIEAIEGYPTGLDASIRNQLQHMGYDPNMVDRAYSFVNSAEALLKLGFNPASAGLHMAQTIAATYPVLGEKYTLLGLYKAYSSEHADLVHNLGIEATSNLLDIDTFNAYKGGYFNEPGLGSKLAGGYKVLQTSGLFLFSKGIETARRIAAVGAYEKALDEGQSPEAARNTARDTLIRTQFMYSPADAPLALRALPRPLTQFRTFTMKMMEFVTGLRGAEVPRFLLAMGAIGYAGLPALTATSSIIEKVFGWNPEDALKKQFPQASRGILGLLGVDYTKNIGFADWLGSRSFDIDRLAGPAGSDLINAAKAGIALAHGPSRQGQQDIDTAVRNFSPELRRIWDESGRIAGGNSALLDPRSGSVIIKNLTPGERLEMLAGLTPIRVAEERDTHDAIRKEIEQSKDVRGYFTDKLASLQIEMMRSDITEQQRMELVAQTAKYAKMAQDQGVGQGLPKAVRDRAKEMFSDRLQRDVHKAPKVVRPQAWQDLQLYQSEQGDQK